MKKWLKKELQTEINKDIKLNYQKLLKETEKHCMHI